MEERRTGHCQRRARDGRRLSQHGLTHDQVAAEYDRRAQRKQKAEPRYLNAPAGQDQEYYP